MTELISERDGSTLVLTLNRPEKMNALSASLVDALLEATTTAAQDGTRLLVLRGAGRNFSAGFDMAGYETHSDGDLLLRFVRIEQLLQNLFYAPYDTLALAHGRNFGAGADLVCSCAQRVATDDANFRMPGLGFGLVLGTRRLAARVGGEAARRVLQTSRSFGTAEAMQIGFLQRLVAREEWDGIVQQAGQSAAMLEPAVSQKLFELTRPDTRAADMADLVASAARPGIKMRIAAYLEAGSLKQGART